MAYQPTPFSLIMPEVPAHMSDGDIAKLWYTINANNEKGLANIRSIQMEPFMRDRVRYNRVTIHFDDFEGALGHHGFAFREQIKNGEYIKYMAGFYISDNITYRSYLLPCETPQPPRTEYSHVVALQLQDVVRQQAEQIRRLEARLNEMETRIHEGTTLQLDINQSTTEDYNKIKRRLDSQEDYSKRLETIIIALEAKHEAENKLQEQEKEWKQKIEALTEWCSQPIWKRTTSFILPKESDDHFVSEF